MANYIFQDRRGIITADTSRIRTEVVEEYRAIFGEDFITDSETPEGMLIDAETTSRQSVIRGNASSANQINPDLAGGIFLDAILALTGDKRTTATHSTVSVNITGIADTVIPAGARARTTEGDLFESTENITISINGTATGNFRSVETGPIPAPPNTLIHIVIGSSVIGWETITNPNAATLGIQQGSDNEARISRRQKLGLFGRSVSNAIISNIREVEGVRSVSFLENVQDTTQDIQGITLVPHSTWVSVQGGDNSAIAAAYFTAKTGGTNFNGSVSVAYTDPYSEQTTNVLFDRPTAVPILVRVTIEDSADLSNPEQDVRQAVLDYAAGNIQNIDGFTIGTDVSPYEIAIAIGIELPTLFISLVEVSLNTDPPAYVSTTLLITISQIATVNLLDIEVIVA